MKQIIDLLHDATQSRYFVPYLPTDLIHPFGVGSLSLSQRTSFEPDPDWHGTGLKRISRDALAAKVVPKAISHDSEIIDKLMIHSIQSSIGVAESIAIIDTGLMAHHPVLRGLVVETVDLVHEGGCADGDDKNGHGTLVALLIALNSPNVEIINIKVADGDGKFAMEVLARGIREAIQRAPNRINLSLGFEVTCGVFRRCEACRAAMEAVREGIMVFAAAGNMPRRRACPARAPGVYSLASYEIRSVLSESSSIPPQGKERLYRKGLSKAGIAEKALKDAQYFLTTYQEHLSPDGEASADGFRAMTSTANLCKESYLLVPESLLRVVEILNSVVQAVFQYPWGTGMAFLDHLWYHMPDKLLAALRGETRGALLPGTSFSVATAMGIPTMFADVIQSAFGQYPISDSSVMQRASYSGNGEFIGADGRFILVPYEMGLIARALLLRDQNRVDHALAKFDPVLGKSWGPTENLEQALYYLVKNEVEKCIELLEGILKKQPNWYLTRRLWEECR